MLLWSCGIFLNDIVWFTVSWLFLSCDSWATKTASCPVNCRQRCSRSWRSGRTSWTMQMETKAKVWERNQAPFGGSAGVSLCWPEPRFPSRSAGWPELAAVGGFCEVLRGAGGPLSPLHGRVVQRKQRAPTRQFPQMPPVPRRPAVPTALHGNSDVCWIHSGQGAVQGRRARLATRNFSFYNRFLFLSWSSSYTHPWGSFRCRLDQPPHPYEHRWTSKKCV